MTDESVDTSGIVVQEARAPRTRVARTQEPNEGTVLLQVIARAAQDPTLDLERMERLLVMHERLNARRAEQEFVDAMARFKENAPTIIKDKKAGFEHRDGEGRTEYTYATLGNVVRAAVGPLGQVGISASWDVKQDGGMIEVSCILTHKGGHSIKRTMKANADNSGKKNAIQQIASTVSYLERYTFLAATGLAVEDQDDDGRSSDAERVNEEQVANLEALLTEVGSNKINFLRWAGVETLQDIPLANYNDCIKALERKRTT
jgi:ERF superfamily